MKHAFQNGKYTQEQRARIVETYLTSNVSIVAVQTGFM